MMKFNNWDNTFNFIRYSNALSEINDITPKKAKEQFEKTLRKDAETHPECEYYLKNGSWRDSKRPSEQTVSEAIPRIDELKSRQCYYNAQTSLSPRTTYVEGYLIILPQKDEETTISVAHAWLETNEQVIELDPTIEQSNTLYFGVEFANNTIHETLVEKETADPIVTTTV